MHTLTGNDAATLILNDRQHPSGKRRGANRVEDLVRAAELIAGVTPAPLQAAWMRHRTARRRARRTAGVLQPGVFTQVA